MSKPKKPTIGERIVCGGVCGYVEKAIRDWACNKTNGDFGVAQTIRAIDRALRRAFRDGRSVGANANHASQQPDHAARLNRLCRKYGVKP